MAESRKFQNPDEVKLPAELDGWEEMYPSQRLFSKDREEWEKRHFWFQDKIHAPEPLYPFDDIFQEAWQIALSQYTTRVFCIPPAQGIAQRMLGCYMYIAAVEPPPRKSLGRRRSSSASVFPSSFKTTGSYGNNGSINFRNWARTWRASRFPNSGNLCPMKKSCPSCAAPRKPMI
jgi:pyruvate,water dikinase